MGPLTPMRVLIYCWLPVTKTSPLKNTVMANSRGVHLLALFSMSSDLNGEEPDVCRGLAPYGHGKLVWSHGRAYVCKSYILLDKLHRVMVPTKIVSSLQRSLGDPQKTPMLVAGLKATTQMSWCMADWLTESALESYFWYTILMQAASSWAKQLRKLPMQLAPP